MRVLLTGHKGYIGAVAATMLGAAGHDVTGLDADLFAGCDFGKAASEVPEIQKDIRDLSVSDLEGFDAVVHLAALSNDPLGQFGCQPDIRNQPSGFGSDGPSWRRQPA